MNKTPLLRTRDVTAWATEHQESYNKMGRGARGPRPMPIWPPG